MAGIYEALLRADEQRFPTAPGVHADEQDLAAVGAMLQRLEERVESELPEDYDAGFEHFASLEVSIGALEDRLFDRELEQEAASTSMAESVERLVAEVGGLNSRLDRELPLLRSELIQTIERCVSPEHAARRKAKRTTGAGAGLARLFRRLAAGRYPG